MTQEPRNQAGISGLELVGSEPYNHWSNPRKARELTFKQNSMSQSLPNLESLNIILVTPILGSWCSCQNIAFYPARVVASGAMGAVGSSMVLIGAWARFTNEKYQQFQRDPGQIFTRVRLMMKLEDNKKTGNAIKRRQLTAKRSYWSIDGLSS